MDTDTPELSSEDTSLTTPSLCSDTQIPPGVPNVQYLTVAKLFRMISQTSSSILFVEGISASDVMELNAQRETRRPKFRLKSFVPHQNLMIITIPTRQHEFAGRGLFNMVSKQLGFMGLDEQHWADMGSTLFHKNGRNAAGGSGEGDAVGGPDPERVDGWPTLVIEAGYSQSMPALRLVMRRWFDMSNFQVKIVLLVKIKPRGISIEKWQGHPRTERPGATSTRATSALPDNPLQPELTQAIEVIPRADLDRALPSSYVVTRGELQLEFVDLFLRSPQPGERDVIISIATLQWLAARIWRASLS